MNRRARGQGTVYQDGDIWIARIDLPIGADGKRRQWKRRAPTKTAAFEKLKQLQDEIEDLENPNGLRRTVKQAVNTFLKSQRNHNRAEMTVRIERWRGDVVIAGMGRRQIGKLTVHQCDRFLELAAAGEYGSRTMNLDTIKRIRRLLINALNNEIRLGNLNRNVADLSLIPDIAETNQTTNEDGDTIDSIRRTLTYGEYRTLWDTSRYPLKLAIDLCGRNGLRPSEARGLRWSRVDLNAQTIKIDRQMSSKNKLVPPKTKRSRRTIQFDEITAECLKEWQQLQAAKKQRYADRWKPNNLVISTRYGTPIEATNLLRSIDSACTKNDIDRIVPYELRHTAITFQVDAGNETWQVADWAGTSVRMIDNVYRHRLTTIAPLTSVPLKDEEE